MSGSVENVWGKCEIMTVTVVATSTDSFYGGNFALSHPLGSLFSESYPSTVTGSKTKVKDHHIVRTVRLS